MGNYWEGHDPSKPYNITYLDQVTAQDIYPLSSPPTIKGVVTDVWLKAGWNLFSPPPYARFTLPSKYMPVKVKAYTWDTSSKHYVNVSEPNSRGAYWLYCNTTMHFYLAGLSVNRNVTLAEGWNLIPAPVEGGCLSGGGFHLFTWNSFKQCYVLSSEMHHCRAYWVYATAPGEYQIT